MAVKKLGDVGILSVGPVSDGNFFDGERRVLAQNAPVFCILGGPVSKVFFSETLTTELLNNPSHKDLCQKKDAAKAAIQSVYKEYPSRYPRLSIEQSRERSERLKPYQEQEKICLGEMRKIGAEFCVDLLRRADTKVIPLRELKSGIQYGLYKNAIYKFDRPGYSEEEMLLQVMDLEDDERQRFERLKHKFSVARHEEVSENRERISEEVRVAVWRRDQGKCAKCSSREKLEYDHIVPVSKGGSNAIRNIELLCEKCNREKGNTI